MLSVHAAWVVLFKELQALVTLYSIRHNAIRHVTHVKARCARFLSIVATCLSREDSRMGRLIAA